ncbi:hypothetical protein K439DRAFT_1126615 [Ramaria rubella]|nr:hypothetical protein K439DRAFT_1126615 [Ramaria rubella]
MSVAPPTNTTEGINLSVTFAPIYWGFVISLLLGGISIVQGYIYFLNNNDRLSIQVTAGAMLVLDLVSSALVAQSVYYYLIPHFGSLLPLGSITSELSVECLVSTIITLISQLYFVKQLYAVTKGTWFVSGVIGLFAIFAFAFGVACTAAMIVHNHSVLDNRADVFQIFFGLAKGFGAVTDIGATIAMCTFLASSRTGMNRTNSMIKSLIHFVVNRGALVTLIQTLLLIMFFAVPTRLYWLAFHINVTKLYVNTFFAMLNGRSHLHQKSTMFTSSELQSYTNRGATYASQNKPPTGAAIISYCKDSEHTDDKGCAPSMPTVTTTTLVMSDF